MPYDDLQFEMNRTDNEQYGKELKNLIDDFNKNLDDITENKIKEHLNKIREKLDKARVK